MKLPITFLLFRNITAQQIKPPQKANPKMNIGMFSEVMGNYQQIDILKLGEKNSLKPYISYKLDEGDIDTRTGSQVIPEVKDFYMGEPI